MSGIALLMGLLVLSYIGSVLVGSGKKPGLPSGIEFVGLGFAVGPHALRLIERPMIVDFEPIVQVALGWLAFVVGLEFGRVDGRRVGRASLGIGIGAAILTGGAVAFAVHALLDAMPVRGIDRHGATVLAAGAGAVCAETARGGVEWARSRWGASGPVSDLLVDIGAADDLALLVVAGAVFAIAPSSALRFSLSAWGWFGASVGLGALLGVATAMLLRGAEGDAVWGALIGTILLGVGVAARFGLCTIFVTFVMGIALAAASPRRRVLRKVVIPTERAVVYPMLLLAGAQLDPAPIFAQRSLLVLVVAVLGARVVAKLVAGGLVRRGAARSASSWLGLSLLSSGPVSTACGLAFALRFPGPVGDTLLFCAVASAVLGELLSTLSLKSILSTAGEIVVPVPAVEREASVPALVPHPPSSSRLAAHDGFDDEDDEA